MGVAIHHPQPDPVTPYRYIAGEPSVDFVNTADWIDQGLDRFTSYQRVIEWGVGANVVTSESATTLLDLAADHPFGANRVLSDAIELRALLERIFFLIASDQPSEAEIRTLNERWLKQSADALAIIARADGHLALGWPAEDQSLESPLWRVAWLTARLLTSEDVSRIRRCGGDDCGWYYVDRSRNGLRRWCEMETCGTRMKSKRRAERAAEK